MPERSSSGRRNCLVANLPGGECGGKGQVSRSHGSLKIKLYKGIVNKMFEDKTLVCKDCGAEFIFSAGEQEFYAEKGFQNEPIRCKACRNARKSQRNGEKEMYDAVCAQCGAPTKIPFVPKNDRPIYCSACFQARRANH